MTMYFPLVVHGAMLVEPTETEGKATLDQFIGALRSVVERAKAGDPALKAAPALRPAPPPPRRDRGGAQARAGVEGCRGTCPQAADSADDLSSLLTWIP